MILTESRADLLTEVMNMGMGHAANTLNQLVGTHVELRVPSLSMLSVREAHRRLADMGWMPVSAVQMEFEGSLRGNVALIFPAGSAVKLVSLLTGDSDSDSDVDSLRKATFEEAGNILLNGVLGAISNLLNNQVTFSVPYYIESDTVVEDLVKSQHEETHVILSHAHFTVSQFRIEGEILLYFEVQSLEGLFAALDRQIEEPAVIH